MTSSSPFHLNADEVMFSHASEVYETLPKRDIQPQTM